MTHNYSRGLFYKTMSLAAILVGIPVISPHCSRDTYRVTVTGTERVTERLLGTDSQSGITSTYVVFTQDANTGIERAFENTDSLLECVFSSCKFDSSTLHARLVSAEKSGAVCDIQTYGWRLPFFSMYENIIEANCKKLE